MKTFLKCSFFSPMNMVDEERYKKNVANKKQNPLSYGYNVYEEQYDELGNPIERSVLEKYDDEIEGQPKKRKNFVIGESMDEEREHRRKLLEIKTKLAGKRLETLEDTNLQLASDTYSTEELAKYVFTLLIRNVFCTHITFLQI